MPPKESIFSPLNVVLQAVSGEVYPLVIKEIRYEPQETPVDRMQEERNKICRMSSVEITLSSLMTNKELALLFAGRKDNVLGRLKYERRMKNRKKIKKRKKRRR